jgi:phenylacetate-coenzyme A ligase PaaK-like adenylate-forming protein
MLLQKEIFNIKSEKDFNDITVEIFHFQYEQNLIYHDFVNAISFNPSAIKHYEDIPFLPISFFKTQRIISGTVEPALVFLSSGTTGMIHSKHYVVDVSVYERSLLKGFEYFYGPPSGYKILGLVPDPQENPNSSLGFMVDLLMETAHRGEKNFYLHDFPSLHEKILSLKKSEKKTILIGLTSALIDFAEQFPAGNPDLIVMETGGMKGKRKEIIREELHVHLCQKFGVTEIQSEYGMTELLSQAYSKGNGIFSCPPWMKVLIRDINDPFTLLQSGQTGGISVIDLANLNSCPFIATQDLGKLHNDHQFEILGRFDHSEIRGCNVMAL